jgi:hypothetical protein
LQQLTDRDIHVNICEIRKAEIDAQLVAENIALQLERRVAFRRAMKRSVMTAIRFGAEGIKISCNGRLGGAEMARGEGGFAGSGDADEQDEGRSGDGEEHASSITGGRLQSEGRVVYSVWHRKIGADFR